MLANSVRPHLYVKRANICVVKRGKAPAAKLPEKLPTLKLSGNFALGTHDIGSALQWLRTRMFHNCKTDEFHFTGRIE